MSSFVICLGLIHDQHQHQQEQQELGKRVSVIWFGIHSRRTEERENPSFLPSFLWANGFVVDDEQLSALHHTIEEFARDNLPIHSNFINSRRGSSSLARIQVFFFTWVVVVVALLVSRNKTQNKEPKKTKDKKSPKTSVNLKKKMCNEMRGYATRSHVDGDHLKLLGL